MKLHKKGKLIIYKKRDLPAWRLTSLFVNNGFATTKVNFIIYNKKTPEDVYAGCVGVRKNYRYVEWQWKVEYCMQQMCAGETEMFC